MFRAKKSTVRRAVSAGRLACGDGAKGCTAGTTCRTDCTCSTPGDCTGVLPQAQFTQGGTLVAGAAVTFDAGTSTATIDLPFDPQGTYGLRLP